MQAFMKAILATLILKTSILGDQISGAQNLEKRDLREQMQRKITIEANGEIFIATLANTVRKKKLRRLRVNLAENAPLMDASRSAI